jgi:hypothetical protein
MIETKQTKFGDHGNCFAACIASLFELPLDDVPDFCSLPPDWWRGLQDWLKRKGLCAIEVRLEPKCLVWSEGCNCILTGTSPRGRPHSVIAKTVCGGFEYVFDPHPDNTFLSGEPTHVLFLVPLDVNKLEGIKNIVD